MVALLLGKGVVGVSKRVLEEEESVLIVYWLGNSGRERRSYCMLRL